MCRKTYKTALSGLCSILITMIGLPAAFAGTGAASVPSFPPNVRVGDTGIPVSLTLINATILEAGDLDDGSVELMEIRVVPACGSDSYPCPNGDEAGVFAVSATGTGANGCAGITFDIVGPDANNGYDIVPQAGSPAINLGLFQNCQVSFTVDVLAVPVADAEPDAIPGNLLGVQTIQKSFCRIERLADRNLSGEGVGTIVVSVEYCGDGILQDGEFCDGTPGCREDCTECGDGIVQSEYGETCDGTPGCREDCTECGDGIVQSEYGEECDDGNVVSGDGCEADCTLPTGNEGCTPGFWKANYAKWNASAWPPYALEPAELTVADLFGPLPDGTAGLGEPCAGIDLAAEFGDWTLIEALKGRGGPGVYGAAEILLRAAAAAWLNTQNACVAYGYAEVITIVNEVLNTCDRGEILSVAGDLDDANNAEPDGCPLSQHDVFGECVE